MLSFANHLSGLLSMKYLLVKTSEDSILMKQNPKCDMNNAISKLQQKGLNVVPESDIGLGILNNNTDRFCNPALSQQLLLNSTALSTQASATPQIILAPETQNLLPPSPKKSGGSITGKLSLPTPSSGHVSETPCTASTKKSIPTQADASLFSRKRRLSETDCTPTLIENPTKKLALEVEATQEMLKDTENMIDTQVFQEVTKLSIF